MKVVKLIDICRTLAFQYEQIIQQTKVSINKALFSLHKECMYSVVMTVACA
jgi:hypothetical protein